jgi:hypothetical protein
MDRQYVGVDFHRRRSVIVRLSAAGEKLSSVRVANDPLAIAATVAEAGPDREVVIEDERTNPPVIPAVRPRCLPLAVDATPDPCGRRKESPTRSRCRSGSPLTEVFGVRSRSAAGGDPSPAGAARVAGPTPGATSTTYHASTTKRRSGRPSVAGRPRTSHVSSPPRGGSPLQASAFRQWTGRNRRSAGGGGGCRRSGVVGVGLV